MVAVVVVAVILGMVFGLKGSSKPAVLVPYAAVVSNGKGCASIGSAMLDDGGSAVDAAIATLLCEGVMLPQSMGVGGGFFAVIYNKTTGQVEALNARESAPIKSTPDMFVNETITGAKAGGVPGELLGYWNLHQKYGRLPWKQLFTPTIELCKNGHYVSVYLNSALKKNEQRILNEPSMSEIFINPDTNAVWKTGDYMKRPKLAETFEIIAEKGVDPFYKGGDIGKMFIEDMAELGGIMIEDDLTQYNVTWDPPLSVDIFDGYKLYTTPLPSSGAVLAMILNIAKGFEHRNEPLYWHHVVESFKHGYGHRTHLGDMHFEPDVEPILKKMINPDYASEIARKRIFDDRTFTDYKYYGAEFSNNKDHGTANLAVVDHQGNAITVTSTVNRYFGGKVRSKRTGIIINDEMDDFSTPGTLNSNDIPPSKTNFIKPGKRPMSSMCPSIILDKDGNVRMLVGAAGGSMITTTVAQAILKYLALDWNINDAVQSHRLHHQLAPMEISYEQDMKPEILSFLERVGHTLKVSAPGQFSALTAIGLKNDIPVPTYDERRVGSAAVVHPKNKMVH